MMEKQMLFIGLLMKYIYIKIKLNDLIETDLDIMRSNYGHFINTGDIPGQDVSDLKNFYIKIN